MLKGQSARLNDFLHTVALRSFFLIQVEHSNTVKVDENTTLECNLSKTQQVYCRKNSLLALSYKTYFISQIRVKQPIIAAKEYV